MCSLSSFVQLNQVQHFLCLGNHIAGLHLEAVHLTMAETSMQPGS